MNFSPCGLGYFSITAHNNLKQSYSPLMISFINLFTFDDLKRNIIIGMILGTLNNEVKIIKVKNSLYQI